MYKQIKGAVILKRVYNRRVNDPYIISEKFRSQNTKSIHCHILATHRTRSTLVNGEIDDANLSLLHQSGVYQI